MKPLCTREMHGRAGSIIPGVAKTATVMGVCGRPAVDAFRGLHIRDDGTIYLRPWTFRCQRHSDPKWEARMRRWHPELGDRVIYQALP